MDMMKDHPVQVLLVEDDPGHARLFMEFLTRSQNDPLLPNLEITTVGRLADALALIAEKDFDVALIDLSLPDSFGLDTFRRIHDAASHVALIILSGNDDERVSIQAVSEGAQDYISKGRVDDYFLKRSIRYALERKKAEAHIKYQAHLLEGVSDAIIASDMESNITSWNPAAEQVYGWRADEVVGKPIEQFLQTEYEAGDSKEHALQQFLEQGLWRGEVTQRRRDGKKITVLASVSLVRDARGVPQEMVGVNRDITERKQAEEKVKRQLNRLNALREIDLAISSSFNVNVTLDVVLQQTISQLNVDAVAILLFHPGLQEVEYAGGRGFYSQPLAMRQKLSDGYVSRILRERRTIHISNLENATQPYVFIQLVTEGFTSYAGTPLIAKGEIKGVMEVYHRSYLKPDQDWLDFLETLAGQAAIAIDNAQLFDRLQRANAELEQRVVERTAELNQLNLELQHANQAKDEFLATMSHELRTPLNSILGLSESLLEQRRDSLSDHQQQSLQIISTSGRHLLELVNDVLDLSKMEAGKFDFYPQIVDVETICQSSLSFVKEQAMRKSIALIYQEDADVSKVHADPRRLKQVIINLLTNAVKFTPDHGQVTLQVRADADEDIVRFSIIDNGIGIAPEDLKRLFQPFVQVDSSFARHFEGTGLGLAVVQKLTDLHGGSVQVESEVGVGSSFTVNIPWGRHIIAQEEGVEEHDRLIDEPLENSSTRGVVLLAEDNVANILTISEYLESHGYEVVVAHNGLEAIEKAEGTNPDIILMDVQMPAMDGLEATRRLKENPRFASTPIIALTALAMTGDRERCLEAGASEYMSKPVRLKELVKLMGKLIKRAG